MEVITTDFTSFLVIARGSENITSFGFTPARGWACATTKV